MINYYISTNFIFRIKNKVLKGRSINQMATKNSLSFISFEFNQVGIINFNINRIIDFINYFLKQEIL